MQILQILNYQYVIRLKFEISQSHRVQIARPDSDPDWCVMRDADEIIPKN
jgi:hypothetical protein